MTHSSGTGPSPGTLALEPALQTIGASLLSEVRNQETKGRISDVFYDRLMELSTRDEKLKVELFRFVDALPALKTPESVARHLSEYLVRPDVQLPPGGAQLINFLGSNLPALLPRLIHECGAELEGGVVFEERGAAATLRHGGQLFTLVEEVA